MTTNNPNLEVLKQEQEFVNFLREIQKKINFDHYSYLGINPKYYPAIHSIFLNYFSYNMCLSQIEFEPDYVPIFFDVGCNINSSENTQLDDFTKLCLRKFKNCKCYGIEPLHWEKYEETYKNNPNVTLIKKALSDKLEQRVMYTPEFFYDHGGSFLGHGGSSLWNRKSFNNFEYPDVTAKTISPKEISVDCVTIDSLMEEYNLNMIDYLKIDTEGSEFLVLKGAENSLINKKIKFIQVEYGEAYYDANTSVKEIHSYLEKLEYHIVSVTKSEILFACSHNNSKSTFTNIPIKEKDEGVFVFSGSTESWGELIAEDILKSSLNKVQTDKINELNIPEDYDDFILCTWVEYEFSSEKNDNQVNKKSIEESNMNDNYNESIQDDLDKNLKIKGPYDSEITESVFTQESVNKFINNVSKHTKPYYEQLGVEPVFHEYVDKMKTGAFEDKRVSELNEIDKLTMSDNLTNNPYQGQYQIKFKPPQPLDNIFPEGGESYKTYTIENLCNDISKNYVGEGDVLEFGVASCMSTMALALKNPDRKIFGIDHFKGLEKTSKNIPEKSGWHEGAFRLGDPDCLHIPDTMDAIYRRIAPYPNISLIVEDIHNLKEPSDYGIGKICAVNLDVDIYEPAVSALNFIDKCEWDRIYIRFDDWHGHEPEYDQHERLACREWLEKNQYQFCVPANATEGAIIVWRQRIDEGEIDEVLAETFITVSDHTVQENARVVVEKS